MKNLCVCGRGLNYAECCQPFHSQQKNALSAEALMRSRFSAFFMSNAPYLLNTHYPETRGDLSITSLEKSFNDTRWLSLKIINSTKTTVEFVAFFCEKKNQVLEPNQLHEKSEFIFENNQWFYKTGIHLPPVKLGRNDVCWCGSGKKLKKCHGAN